MSITRVAMMGDLRRSDEGSVVVPGAHAEARKTGARMLDEDMGLVLLLIFLIGIAAAMLLIIFFGRTW